MPLDSTAGRQIAASLAYRAGGAATAAQIADATVASWQVIDSALAPIVGQRGVAALYKRSLHLNRHARPCLETALEGSSTQLELELLKAAMAQQSADDAAAIGGEVLQTFHELLTTLLGPSLTERLLRSVWTHFLSGPTAQDPSR
jgi:hypothetical protein